MRRSASVNLALVIAIILANCLSAVASDRVRTTDAPASGNHLIALRLNATGQVIAPRLKGSEDRVTISSSLFDRSAVVASHTLHRSGAVHTAQRLSVGLLREAPSACRPPPSQL